MSVESCQILAALLAAHLVGDFWLQPGWMYQRKRHLSVLALHGLVHAVLVVCCIGLAGDAWIAPVAVFATHVPIDYAKAKWGQDSLRWFAGDQIAHALVLFALALLLPGRFGLAAIWPTGVYEFLAVLAGWIATISAGRFLIGLAVADFESARPDRDAGLPQAGRIIGQLERALVFVLVLAGQLGAIGFLVAAKSVFRFGDLQAADERKESEYVIIGTLMSFGFAMLAALATTALLAEVRGS